jgi:hypothetical protein
MSKAYFNWLADISMPHPAQQITLLDLTRFDSPIKLMVYLGLVPSAYDIGDKNKK